MMTKFFKPKLTLTEFREQPERKSLRCFHIVRLTNKLLNLSQLSVFQCKSRRFEFGKVLTFTKTWSSRNDVKLHDLLSGKYHAPLTLRDFEDYLSYIESTPENLYFYLWLEAYTERYHQWQSEQPASKLQTKLEVKTTDARQEVQRFWLRIDELPPSLLQHLEMAVQTFVVWNPTSTARADLQLNLTAQQKDQLILDTQMTGDPTIFRNIEREVMYMLEESMRRWVALIPTVAQRRRPSHKRRFFSHRWLGSSYVFRKLPRA